MYRNQRNRNRRKGATLVEFAVAAPVVFLIFFTGYEFSRVNMVRHSLDIAAYEGARVGILPGASANDVDTRVREMLQAVSIQNATVDITPGTIEDATREITVDLEVPMQNNGWVTPRFLGNNFRLRATSTLAREGFTN